MNYFVSIAGAIERVILFETVNYLCKNSSSGLVDVYFNAEDNIALRDEEGTAFMTSYLDWRKAGNVGNH